MQEAQQTAAGIQKCNIRLRKNRENVVLMHDFSGNYKTIGALDRIIKYGKSHGYEFRAITDSTTAVHHGVQN